MFLKITDIKNIFYFIKIQVEMVYFLFKTCFIFYSMDYLFFIYQVHFTIYNLEFGVFHDSKTNKLAKIAIFRYLPLLIWFQWIQQTYDIGHYFEAYTRASLVFVW